MANGNEDKPKLTNQNTPSQINGTISVPGSPQPQVLPSGKVIAPNTKSSSVTGSINPGQPFN